MSDSTKKVHYLSEEQIAMKVVKLNPKYILDYQFQQNHSFYQKVVTITKKTVLQISTIPSKAFMQLYE